MIGATAENSGIAGLVPRPAAGDQDKFLRGDGTWVNVEATLSAEDQAVISNLQAVTSTLIGDDEGKSVSQIVSELLIPENASESLDTLQEIANWIQNHPGDASEINTSITQLQTKVGNLENSLNGANGLIDNVSALELSVNELQATVGTFVAVPGTYSDIGSAISYLNGSVAEINDRLRWHELDEE